MIADTALRLSAFFGTTPGVWVAESEDVPGRITEAETREALMEKWRVLVPELKELSRSERKTANIHLHSDRTILLKI